MVVMCWWVCGLGLLGWVVVDGVGYLCVWGVVGNCVLVWCLVGCCFLMCWGCDWGRGFVKVR